LLVLVQEEQMGRGQLGLLGPLPQGAQQQAAGRVVFGQQRLPGTGVKGTASSSLG
jgi:hypothetical protein